MDTVTVENSTDQMTAIAWPRWINNSDGAEQFNTSDKNGHNLQHPPLLKSTLSVYMILFLCVAYAVVFILAVVNNSLVLTVIYKNQQMKTVTNYFLANLAVADITVSFIVLPITLLSNIMSEWWFGSFMCKAIPYLQAVAVGASVNTLSAVAVERYFAIFHALDRMITPARAVSTIAALWILPGILQVPWILFSDVKTYSNGTHTITLCLQQFPSLEFEKGFFLGVMFLTCYLIPLCFISICYTLIGVKVWKRNVGGMKGSQAERNMQRCKIRIVRMLITVAAVFAFLWIPLYALRLHLYFGPRPSNMLLIRDVLTPWFQWMGSATSAINPFIYCYFSFQFRKYMFELMPCKEIRNTTNNKTRHMKLQTNGSYEDNETNVNLTTEIKI